MQIYLCLFLFFSVSQPLEINTTEPSTEINIDQIDINIEPTDINTDKWHQLLGLIKKPQSDSSQAISLIRELTTQDLNQPDNEYLFC